MIYDLNYNIQIIGCPTIRELNGLAMSSRNQYLSTTEKDEAAIIYQTLQMAKKMVLEKVQNIKNIKYKMKEKLLKSNFKVEYISIADLNTFEETNKHIKLQTVISMAVYYKNVRLIDNVVI